MAQQPQDDKIIKDTQSDPLPPLKEIFFLTINVKSAEGLKAADLTGSSDPFCKVIANKQTWTTKVIMKNLNPEWKEETSFVFFEPCDEIQFEVWDWDKGTKHDNIGRVTLKKGEFDYKNKSMFHVFKYQNDW